MKHFPMMATLAGALVAGISANAHAWTEHPPVANPGGPYRMFLTDTAQLDGSASFDVDAAFGDTIVSYDWDLNGDGNYEQSSSRPTMSVNWSTLLPLGLAGPGLHGVSLRVRDTLGATSLASTTLDIVDRPPVARTGGPYVMAAGSGLILDTSASFDPDAPIGDHVAYYSWDLNGAGIFGDISGSSPIAVVSHAQLTALGVDGLGEHLFSLKARDLFGTESGIAVTTLTVTAAVPEPAEYALLLAGIGVVGAAVRRRRAG